MTQVVLLQPIEDHSGADISTLQSMGAGADTGAGGYVLKEAAAHGEPAQEQAPDRTCDLCRGIHAEGGFKNFFSYHVKKNEICYSYKQYIVE